MITRDLLSLMPKTFLITILVVQQILPIATVGSVITVLVAQKERPDLRIVSAAFWFLGKYECFKWAWCFIIGFCFARGTDGLYSCR